MYEVSDFYRRTTAIMCLVMGVVLIVSLPACSRAPEDPAWFQSTSTGESLDEDVLISRIEEVDDLFAIYRMQKEYRIRGGQSEAINKALEKRWENLLADHSPLSSLCEEVDLIAFDYRRIGDKQYRANFLYRVNQPFSQDYKIGLYGIVDESNYDLLSEGRKKLRKKSEVWNFYPSPTTTTWPVGEYILISRTLFAQPIPYKMNTFFYDPNKSGSRHGQRFDLGWRTTSITEDELISRFESCRDFFDLYRLQTWNQVWLKKSETVRESFEKKSRQLLKGVEPLGHICPEADLLAFDYKKVGDDQYRADFLFKVNQPFSQDYKIGLYGIVDKSNSDFISEGRKKLGKMSEAWTFHPTPPTSQWSEGEYVLISNWFHAQPIPYKMHLVLFDPEKTGRLYGQRLDLGWRVDLGE